MRGPNRIILLCLLVATDDENVKYEKGVFICMSSLNEVSLTTNTPVRKSLRDAFTALYRLRTLESLTFAFNPNIRAESRLFDISAPPSRFLLLQWDVLRALGRTPNPILPTLQSLAIENWLPVPHTLYAEAPFRQIIASLRHLRFLACANDYNIFHDEDPRWMFWRQVVEQNVLLPAVNLESLTVIYNLKTAPPLDFNGLAYSHLTVISLRNIIWGVWGDSFGSVKGGMALPEVENFVVRHGKTLKKLELRSCVIGILKGNGAPRRSWAVVWRRLTDELTELVDLVVEFEADSHRADREKRYVCYSAGHSYIYFGNHVSMGEDVLALGAFRAIVEARKSNWEENGNGNVR